LTATVSPVAPAVGVPTGTVTFSDGTTSLGVVTLVDGTATLSVSTLGAGAHSLTVAYAGDAGFAGSSSGIVTQTVNRGITNTSLASTPNPSVAGQAVTLLATVTPEPPAVGVPTGTMTFTDGVTTLAMVDVVDGTASFTISTLTTDVHSFGAIYSGGPGFIASSSPAVTQTVGAGTTSTILLSSSNISVTGQAVTLTATVSPNAPAAGVPTGTVTFANGVPLGTVPLVNGSASLTVSTLAAGPDLLTAEYGGDVNFAASTSLVLTQTVNQGSTSTSLTSSLDLSVNGQVVTLTATVSPEAPANGVPTGTV